MTTADLLKRTSITGSLVLVLLLSACTSDSADGADGGRTGCTTTTVGSAPAGTAENQVEDLGVSFLLPASYQPASDPDFAFLARSRAPRAIFSIEGPAEELGPPPDRDGETSSPIDLGCVEGYVITDADVPDLPPGIVANELVVNDGDRSFSVILSASQNDLDAAWSTFMDSLAIDG